MVEMSGPNDFSFAEADRGSYVPLRCGTVTGPNELIGAPAKANDVKLCPFCAEEIQDAAIKCKHCGSTLTGIGNPPALPADLKSSPKDAMPWYFKPGMLVVSFLVVGPLMLPLLWFNPHVNRRNKLVWTLVISVVSFVLVLVTAKAVSTLMEYYKLMGL